ncbi:MAG: glycosyltransferase family A protein [Xanthobacteraceae bacterium]
MTVAPRFTIFTPTYNRAHTLQRGYDSLRAQTLRDFEWIVIDDGSTDGTEELVGGWIEAAGFPIRYLRQDHAGKHMAHNLGLREARGYFFSCLDSDDALTPSALERLDYHWRTIPDAERCGFYAVDGLCCDQYGNIIGDKYPAEPLDATISELKYIYRLRGEKWGVGLTEILRRYPFPDVARGTYLPEGIVWQEIGKTYKSRSVNEIVRVYFVDEGHSGVTVDKKRNLTAHAAGRWHYYTWLLNNDLGYFFRAPLPFIKAAIMLPIVARASRQTLARTFAGLNGLAAKLLVLLALPLSALLCLYDNAKTRARRMERHAR